MGFARRHAHYRCPSCRWPLGFEARDLSWEAFCWNPNCKVDVVPARVNDKLLAWLRGRGEVVSTEVAAAFGYSTSNADNHLTALLRLGMVERRRVDPVKGGKRFAWRAAA